ncbi:MAG: preprotein translocase subunit YajC [Sulfurimonas sp.]|jgi:preprotein translocase subunit YajC
MVETDGLTIVIRSLLLVVILGVFFFTLTRKKDKK